MLLLAMLQHMCVHARQTSQRVQQTDSPIIVKTQKLTASASDVISLAQGMLMCLKLFAVLECPAACTPFQLPDVLMLVRYLQKSVLQASYIGGHLHRPWMLSLRQLVTTA